MAVINRASEVETYYYFRAQGMTHAGAIGTIDNLEAESDTVYAIKEYQKKKKLEVDGCAGKATWKSILLR